MQIIAAEAFPVTLRLTEPFAIASETVETIPNIFFRLETDGGLVGWGCTAPDPVTGEDEETVLCAFENRLAPILDGADPIRIHYLNALIERQLTGNTAAKAGVNLALYDILGKAAKLPLFRLLGGYRRKIETSVTVGLNSTDIMVDRATEWVARGFRHLKIKCGIDPDGDIDTVLAIRAAVGPDIKLRLDANEGYNVADTLRVVAMIEEQGGDIEFLEQPTKGEYLYMLKEITAQCNVPIMADETALSLRDSLRLIKLEVADLINIKLMKLGGITNAIKAEIFAELAEVPVMIGCMNESMGAMVAGVHFACAFQNVQYADLDSTLDIADDIVRGGARFEKGYVIPPEEPGLGIEVDL